MSKREKLLWTILGGRSDANIPFTELCNLLHYLGFAERIKGSHHIYTRENVPEILNIQPKGSTAKPYQVKQIRNVLVKYQIGVLNNG
jgi:predicted RNA binding protein YcfA (HicA-like mRNA interferase family)